LHFNSPHLSKSRPVVSAYLHFSQEERHTLHGINGPGRHQAERGAHTPTILVCLFELQMMGDGVFVCV